MEPLSAREAARRRVPLGGADAQALEGALAAAERELLAARAALEAADRLAAEWDEHGGAPGEMTWAGAQAIEDAALAYLRARGAR